MKLDRDLVKLFKRYMRTPDPDKAHAQFSASGSERYIECPGSVKLSEKAPRQPDNIHGIRGTNTHTLLEFLLNEHHYHLDKPEADIFKRFIDYDEAMHGAAQVAVDFVRSEKLRMFKQTDVWPELFVEQKVEFPEVGFGTSDVILYQPFGLLHVMDFKNGKSVVSPENNSQGMYYAYGAAEMVGWDFKDIAITIIQPNAPHKDGPIRTWKTGHAALEQFGRKIRAIVKVSRALKLGEGLHPNPKWCYFCPAKMICPAQREIAQGKVMKLFDVSAKPKTNERERKYGEKSDEKGKQQKKSFCETF